jgi:hypothetical protein
MTSTLTRARAAKRSLRRDLEALRQESRPVEMRRLLPAGWHPDVSGLTWEEWLTQLDECSTFAGHVLTPNTVQIMIAEADRNEAEAKRNGTYREPRQMTDAEWEAYTWERYAEQIARQKSL